VRLQYRGRLCLPLPANKLTVQRDALLAKFLCRLNNVFTAAVYCLQRVSC
jgi:hypothetical protein